MALTTYFVIAWYSKQKTRRHFSITFVFFLKENAAKERASKSKKPGGVPPGFGVRGRPLGTGAWADQARSICLARMLRWISLVPPPMGPTRESRKNICMSYSLE